MDFSQVSREIKKHQQENYSTIQQTIHMFLKSVFFSRRTKESSKEKNLNFFSGKNQRIAEAFHQWKKIGTYQNHPFSFKFSYFRIGIRNYNKNWPLKSNSKHEISREHLAGYVAAKRISACLKQNNNPCDVIVALKETTLCYGFVVSDIDCDESSESSKHAQKKRCILLNIVYSIFYINVNVPKGLPLLIINYNYVLSFSRRGQGQN